MTKNDAVLLTVICHLFVLSIFPDLFVTAASTTTETPNESKYLLRSFSKSLLYQILKFYIKIAV